MAKEKKEMSLKLRVKKDSYKAKMVSIVFSQNRIYEEEGSKLSDVFLTKLFKSMGLDFDQPTIE